MKCFPFPRLGCWLVCLAALIVHSFVAFPRSAAAEEETVRTLDELRTAARQAKPGSTIQIAPGNYEGGLHVAGMHGTADQPITLTAADPKNPPVFRGGNAGIHLSDVSHLHLRHLTIEGTRANGINIDDGGSYDTPTHHIVLTQLVVRDIGPDGNRDGIKLSGIDHFRVEQCTLERWGTSGSGIDMVGCHEGEIVDCAFRHRNDIGANAVQAKGGSSKVAVRYCRFEHAGGRAINLGGSTGTDFFRPIDAAYEAKDITVEDCTFFETSAPVCFVGVDGATVRHNTIYKPVGYVIRILQESMEKRFVPSRNGVFANNLIVFQSSELRGTVNIGPGTQPASFSFRGNHWYCIDRPERSGRLQLPMAEQDATHGVDPKLSNPEKGDLRFDASVVRTAGVRPRS